MVGGGILQFQNGNSRLLCSQQYSTENERNLHHRNCILLIYILFVYDRKKTVACLRYSRMKMLGQHLAAAAKLKWQWRLLQASVAEIWWAKWQNDFVIEKPRRRWTTKPTYARILWGKLFIFGNGNFQEFCAGWRRNFAVSKWEFPVAVARRSQTKLMYRPDWLRR